MVVPAQVKSAISKMFKVSEHVSQSTKAYDEQYDLALQRISTQPTYEAKLARATLAWMTFAHRPLTPVELCTALAMALSEEKDEVDPDFLPDVDVVISLCAGLVTIDREANVIRSGHYTTQEYLERVHYRWFPDGKKDTALTCIWYLSMNTFKDGPRFILQEQYDENLGKYPLLHYAAQHWGRHVKAVETDILEEITILLQQPKLLENINAITSSVWRAHLGYSWYEWDGLSPMEAIPTEGLIWTLKKYLHEDFARILPDTVRERHHMLTNYSPLERAAAAGHIDVVRCLLLQPLQTGLWAGSGDALLAAAKAGFSHIVQTTTDFWAGKSHESYIPGEEMIGFRYKALKAAASSGSLETVRLYLAKAQTLKP
jgi:hypothetical protein